MSALGGHFIATGFSGIENFGAELRAGGAEKIGFLSKVKARMEGRNRLATLLNGGKSESLGIRARQRKDREKGTENFCTYILHI